MFQLPELHKHFNVSCHTTQTRQSFKTINMLTKEEMDKIVEQETFRRQIKTDLEKKDKKENKIVEFFNTTLGIFLLSTFFISFLSWAYTNYSSYKKETAEKERRIESLKLEIINRTQTISSLILDSVSLDDVRQMEVLFSGDLQTAMDYGRVSNKSYYTIEDFKSRGLLPMVTELKMLKHESNFDKTYEAYKEVYDIFLRLQKQINKVVFTRADAAVTKIHISLGDSSMFVNEYSNYLLK